MCTLDINRILKRCKNALKKTGSAESVLTNGVILQMDAYINECGDSELVDAVRDCLYCATKNPVDMAGFAKAIRRYMKLCGCKKTPVWYKTASSRLKKERLDFLDDAYLRNIDISLEPQNTAKKVRRIVEKRVCQAYYRQRKSLEEVNDNSHRSRMKKAVSFQISTLGLLEDIQGFKREKGSHWRRGYDLNLGKVVFRPKQAYNTIEEARLAAAASQLRHPDEGRIQAYLCEHCGKYHIGHSKTGEASNISPFSQVSSVSMPANMAG